MPYIDVLKYSSQGDCTFDSFDIYFDINHSIQVQCTSHNLIFKSPYRCHGNDMCSAFGTSKYFES